jgi:carboxymethylenebutenolidase
MLDCFGLPRRLFATMLAVLLLVSGCDKGDSAATDTGRQADRENVDAVAREHAQDMTAPSEAAQIEPQKAVISERLPYGEVGDELVYGHFVFPADMVDPLPAVIVIHERWGLNDSIKAMTDRLAAEGYIVLAVDLYGGDIATTPGEARAKMISIIENPDRATENIRQAYEFVNTIAGAPTTGSLGWGFGGGWSLRTAMLFPDDLDAAVIYFGQVSADEDMLRPLNVPILGLFGEADTSIPVSSVRAFEASLGRLRKDFEIHVYPGVEHAFANPTGVAYNRKAAEDAWANTLAFLNRTLVSSEEDSE